jgi:hypothetical protein
VAVNQVWRLVNNVILQPGQPVVAAYGPFVGAVIINPQLAVDQGLPVPENLYVDMVNPAGTMVSATTSIIYPGQVFPVPASAPQVSVNAASAGHRFGGYVFQPPANFMPAGTFPPPGPTTVLGGLPSYLYQQYNDDDDLHAFVDAYNQMAQAYISWFANISLPVYTGDQITGALLDWVAAGIYGLTRPVLPSGLSTVIGPYNTAAFNTIPFNDYKLEGPSSFFVTSDDIFKRIMTWSLWRGDGLTFDVRWLKRRVQRFLTGTDGGPGVTDQTYQVSVTFGTEGQININLQNVRRFATKGATFNTGAFNTAAFNQFDTTSIALPTSPYIAIFKAAMEAGVIPVPFQFPVAVNTN